MRQTTLRLTDLVLLVGTRVALGVGIGLLVTRRLDDRVRQGAGIALLAVGVLTTVPLVLSVRAGSSGRPVDVRGSFEREREASGAPAP